MIINDPDILQASKVREDEKRGIIEVYVTDLQALKKVAGKLSAMGFDHCVSVTGLDSQGKISVIWHLSSYSKNEFRGKIVQLKIDAAPSSGQEAPGKFRKPMVSVPSLVDIWESALFHEREAHEMFGIDFQSHPDLRPILLSDDFYGMWPMRKDFTYTKGGIKIE